MQTDDRYKILFEPVQIGPKVAPNRFYQVPHCTGMGTTMPQSTAKFREVKAEGGWGVINTEICMVHPTADSYPFSIENIWDDSDLPGMRLMVDAVHRQKALAGVELGHGGSVSHNRMSRERPISAMPRFVNNLPSMVRQATREDLKEIRDYHRAAARRARDIGFDIIYVYASHAIGLAYDLLSPKMNQMRRDEYGGEFVNRVRFLRELLEDTKQEVGDDCAVAIRFGTDELVGADGFTCTDDGRRVVETLGEMPDLWDVNVNDCDFDMMTARFTDEGFQEPFTAFVKQVTTKPVVGVGRYTSPDRMVSLIRKGHLDMIGAARPSIADPFLPNKIRENRIEDIRECVGCNICLMTKNAGGPIRCTQNPTVGEEWRRGWHPEKFPRKRSEKKFLVIGGGPSGLETAVTLGKRGYEVTLFEGDKELGGRSLRESRLPGLSSYRRVADYRIGQLHKLPNVTTYLGNPVSAEDLEGHDFDHIVVADGAKWMDDGIGRFNRTAIPRTADARVYTPDDVMAGVSITGNVIVYDEESYIMGGVIAEALKLAGAEVTLVTSDSDVSNMLRFTGEKSMVYRRLSDLGVKMVTHHIVTSITAGQAQLTQLHTHAAQDVAADAVVVVGMRKPGSALFDAISQRAEVLAGKVGVTQVGDAWSPGTMAEAVYSGHKFAREFDMPKREGVGFRRERLVVHSLEDLDAMEDFH
ncbi:FAD-dependent oxidoreductase [Xinfangfangia sp. CPCC 101601]|uniref:FAD-dependent oxidoreductase n=1 Tax=Pseudogemmobacter lacusdianii TaxID=3069608 RepID=A0ABU0W1U8_9RHOB|nr:FAD-dependent oxidoreductase [Xinfangfangia sp. CPCC 101601]MDQ2067952.1 FAD-dependent oxidoreductase [Xinfangfangia sp. CPCC 101601]